MVAVEFRPVKSDDYTGLARPEKQLFDILMARYKASKARRRGSVSA